jgi:hypothetical protein
MPTFVAKFVKDYNYVPPPSMDFAGKWQQYWSQLIHQPFTSIVTTNGGSFLYVLLYLGWWAQAQGNSGFAVRTAIFEVKAWLRASLLKVGWQMEDIVNVMGDDDSLMAGDKRKVGLNVDEGVGSLKRLRR